MLSLVMIVKLVAIGTVARQNGNARKHGNVWDVTGQLGNLYRNKPPRLCIR